METVTKTNEYELKENCYKDHEYKMVWKINYTIKQKLVSEIYESGDLSNYH